MKENEKQPVVNGSRVGPKRNSASSSALEKFPVTFILNVNVVVVVVAFLFFESHFERADRETVRERERGRERLELV